MYKNTIRDLIKNATDEQLLLLLLIFTEDEKNNTVKIHKLSNNLFTNFYTMPVIHRRQMVDNGIENLLYLLIQDGLIKNFSVSDGDEIVEVGIETDYYLLPDVLTMLIDRVNKEYAYFHKLLYKKDIISNYSYIIDDKLEIKLKIGEDIVLKNTNLTMQESEKQLDKLLIFLYENYQNDFESLIFNVKDKEMVQNDVGEHCLNVEFVFRDYNTKNELRKALVSEITKRGIYTSDINHNMFRANIYSLEDLEKQILLYMQCQKIEYEKKDYLDIFPYLYKAGVIVEGLLKKNPENCIYSVILANIKNNMAVLYLMCENIPSVFIDKQTSLDSLIPLKRRIAHMDVISDNGKIKEFKPYFYEIKKEDIVDSLNNEKLLKAHALMDEALQLLMNKNDKFIEIIRNNLFVVENMINL